MTRTPRLLTALLSAALVWAAGPALSAPPGDTPPRAGSGEAAKPPEPSRKPATLDELFGRLAAATDEGEANGVARLIERRLEHSGSDTADLLASRAGLALKAEDAPLAVELLDRATQLRPRWADGWNQRAAAFFSLEDPVRAEQDVEEAISLEPRHFAAWAALGHIAMANGDKRRALAAYRRALAIHPFLDGIRKVVDKLAPEVDGRDL